jgi:hypothetical protein
MWSLEQVGTSKQTQLGQGGSGGWCKLLFKGELVCYLETWGFTSCGIGHMQYFKGGDASCFEKKANITSLIEFLRELNGDDLPGTYNPKEWYFILSGNQIGEGEYNYGHDGLKNLIKHPNVQSIDKFENKAHESSGMNLFRLSTEKDFDQWKQLTTQ